MKVRLPNSGGAGNMNQMLKQAQKMQADMAELQADLEQREYTATSGGGMIEVTVDGKHHIKALKINPDAVDPEDTEMLEDLITVAVKPMPKRPPRTKWALLPADLICRGFSDNG